MKQHQLNGILQYTRSPQKKFRRQKEDCWENSLVPVSCNKRRYFSIELFSLQKCRSVLWKTKTLHEKFNTVYKIFWGKTCSVTTTFLLKDCNSYVWNNCFSIQKPGNFHCCRMLAAEYCIALLCNQKCSGEDCLNPPACLFLSQQTHTSIYIYPSTCSHFTLCRWKNLFLLRAKISSHGAEIYFYITEGKAV